MLQWFSRVELLLSCSPSLLSTLLWKYLSVHIQYYKPLCSGRMRGLRLAGNTGGSGKRPRLHRWRSVYAFGDRLLRRTTEAHASELSVVFSRLSVAKECKKRIFHSPFFCRALLLFHCATLPHLPSWSCIPRVAWSFSRPPSLGSRTFLGFYWVLFYWLSMACFVFCVSAPRVSAFFGCMITPFCFFLFGFLGVTGSGAGPILVEGFLAARRVFPPSPVERSWLEI